MDKKPLISIIVPVYKAEKYLTDCIDSIINQTFTDFEMILVDDGSPDRSGKICDDYAINDSRIKVIHKNNGGASTARKAGIEVSGGKYIGWVDADDRIVPEMFSVLYNLIDSYQADIAECQYNMIDGNKATRSGKEEPIVSGTGDFILGEFFNARMKPSFVNKLYKSELFKLIKFPERQIHVDFYVNMQFALMPLTYVRTSKALYYYIVRENSNITTYNARAIREAIYKYDHTMNFAFTAESELARKYLKRDAINRLLGRFSEVTLNSNLKNQNVYCFYIRKKLKASAVKYLMIHRLPFKTRISYLLLLLNMKNFQMFLHRYLGRM